MNKTDVLDFGDSFSFAYGVKARRFEIITEKWQDSKTIHLRIGNANFCPIKQ